MPFQGDQPDFDGFVTVLDTKVAGNASLLYSTYLGGDGFDLAEGIAIERSGLAYVTGYTQSIVFPTRNQLLGDQPSGDAYATVLDTRKAGDASLTFSTYLGGNGDDAGNMIRVSSGLAYVTGTTESTDIPTRNQFQGELQGVVDAFLTVLDTRKTEDVSIVYSTYPGVTTLTLAISSRSTDPASPISRELQIPLTSRRATNSRATSLVVTHS